MTTYSIKLFESDELEKAEIVLAAKAIAEKLQDVAENVSKIEANDLFPLMSQMKMAFGNQMADNFSKMTSDQLRQLLQYIVAAKGEIDNQVNRLEGIVNGTSTDSGNDMSVNAGMETPPDANMPVSDTSQDAPDGQNDNDDAFAPEADDHSSEHHPEHEATPQPSMPPEGRLKKESFAYLDRVILESFKKMMEKKVSPTRAATYIAEKHGVDLSDVVGIIKEAKEKKKITEWSKTTPEGDRFWVRYETKNGKIKEVTVTAEDKNHAITRVSANANDFVKALLVKQLGSTGPESMQTFEESDSNWIEKATEKNSGKFAAKAKKAGESTAEFAKEKEHAKGKLGKEARAAENMAKARKKIDEEGFMNTPPSAFSSPTSPSVALPKTKFTTINNRNEAFAQDTDFLAKESSDHVWNCFGRDTGFSYGSGEEGAMNQLAKRLRDRKANPDAPVSIRKESVESRTTTKKKK